VSRIEQFLSLFIEPGLEEEYFRARGMKKEASVSHLVRRKQLYQAKVRLSLATVFESYRKVHHTRVDLDTILCGEAVGIEI